MTTSRQAEAKKETSSEGNGNVPYPSDEFVSPNIDAFFDFDLAQLRGYRFPQPVYELLMALGSSKLAACSLAAV